MFIRLVLISVFSVLALSMVHANSPMMYNAAFLYNKFAAKIDVNPMFHYSHVNYLNGVCSAKTGPYCLFVNPNR